MVTKEITVPNIGDVSQVEVIEVLVAPGDTVQKDDSLITLESDKASMEIPSPYEGVVEALKVKVGDKVSEGSLILTLTLNQEAAATPSSDKSEPKQSEPAAITEPPIHPVEQPKKPLESSSIQAETVTTDEDVHAGPAVRRLAHEFGVDLNQIKGSGAKNRILTEDVQAFVKQKLTQAPSVTSGLFVSPAVTIDFSKFGEIEKQPLNKIKRLTGQNLHRNWVTIPHVTQFDQADITDLEEFRQANKGQADKKGIKLTPLVFIMKAVIAALKAHPTFNASLDSQGENLIVKKYFNLGIAVDTLNGLVVPVIKNVDTKGMIELAAELAQISHKAREKGLSPADMAGSCFTISSLGGIGGTAFTPIINAPDVAILGVSKAAIAPVYKDGQFIPRLQLPLSLSYDHRVIDGAEGARFLVYLANCLADIRTLLL